MTHTPGLWEANGDQVWSGKLDEHGQMRITLIAARVNFDDAKLIAAAPKMLYAIVKAHELLEMLAPGYMDHHLGEQPYGCYLCGAYVEAKGTE